MGGGCFSYTWEEDTEIHPVVKDWMSRLEQITQRNNKKGNWKSLKQCIFFFTQILEEIEHIYKHKK